MADFDFWQKQSLRPLFGEVDMERPEQKRMAGKLLIIGGNKGAFFAVANAMNEAHKMGVGEVRALLPNSLKNQVPSTPEVYFAEAEKSGAFGRNALNDLLIQAEWAEAIVLIGDMGKNAETTMVFAEFMKQCDKPLFITRDAVDAVTPDIMNWAVTREAETSLLLTMPQLQKALRTLYYPKVVTLSMPTNQLIETLHKFTLSYELSIVTFHNDQIIVAQHGEVVTEDIKDTEWTAITLWGGALAIHEAVLKLWNQNIESRKVLASAVLYK